MSDYRRLDVWRRAHAMTLSVYEVTKNFPKAEMFGLTSQIRRAVASIGANIAEGCGRKGGDLFRHISIAIGSSDELDYYLLLSRDLGFLEEKFYLQLSNNNAEIGRMLSGLKKTVAQRIAASR
jgi:four helix bundle protein